MATETDQKEFKGVSFDEALRRMKDGKSMSRREWNGNRLEMRLNTNANLMVCAQFPDEHSKMGYPYLYIDATRLGRKLSPWTPSQPDLFAEDWFEAL